MDKIFPPAKFYFDHILKDKPGILYTNIYWESGKLKEVKNHKLDWDN